MITQIHGLGNFCPSLSFVDTIHRARLGPYPLWAGSVLRGDRHPCEGQYIFISSWF